jgi:hypothetical protein
VDKKSNFYKDTYFCKKVVMTLTNNEIILLKILLISTPLLLRYDLITTIIFSLPVFYHSEIQKESPRSSTEGFAYMGQG